MTRPNAMKWRRSLATAPGTVRSSGFVKRHRSEDRRIQQELNIALGYHVRAGNERGINLCYASGLAPTPAHRHRIPRSASRRMRIRRMARSASSAGLRSKRPPATDISPSSSGSAPMPHAMTSTACTNGRGPILSCVPRHDAEARDLTRILASQFWCWAIVSRALAQKHANH